MLERIERVIQNNNTLLTDQTFSSVYLKLGYYSPQGIEELNLVDTDNLINFETSGQPTQLRRLKQVAENNMTDANMLLLINVLKQRAVVAGAHAGFMNQLQVETEKLIQDLKN